MYILLLNVFLDTATLLDIVFTVSYYRYFLRICNMQQSYINIPLNNCISIKIALKCSSKQSISEMIAKVFCSMQNQEKNN
jgi:hypothetical protein